MTTNQPTPQPQQPAEPEQPSTQQPQQVPGQNPPPVEETDPDQRALEAEDDGE